MLFCWSRNLFQHDFQLVVGWTLYFTKVAKMWYTPKFQLDTENEAIFEAGKYIFQQAHHFKGIYSSIFGGVLVSIYGRWRLQHPRLWQTELGRDENWREKIICWSLLLDKYLSSSQFHTRWWLNKDFWNFWPRLLGFHDPNWRANFSNRFSTTR